MKALVCFKSIPDVGMLSGQDWKKGDDASVDVTYVKRIFNCFDESAIEMTLMMSDQVQKTGGSFDLSALTIDDKRADLFLTHLLAVGYKTAVRINADIDLRFNSISISRLISIYVKKTGKQQMVVLGTRGGEGDNGQTGMLVAEQLGWPCIRDVIDFNYAVSSQSLEVTSKTENGIAVQTISLPIVLIVGNSVTSPYLRVPTLKQKLQGRMKQISMLSLDDLGVTAAQLEVNDKILMGLWQEKAKQTCIYIDGGNAAEKARHLFDRYLGKALKG